MRLWLDNHLSPAMAEWIAGEFGHECVPVRALGLASATDRGIFDQARAAGAVVVSKDADFAELVNRLGPPPAVILLTCGNTSDARLRVLFGVSLRVALALIEAGEPIVEIGGG